MPQALSIVWNIDKRPAIRKEKLDGREYLVVPMSMILEGVHTGSQGAIYYPKDELSKTPAMWNMKPVTLQHPFRGDTATDLDVYKKQAIGMIMHAQWKDNKLKAEAWLDKEKVEKKEPSILEHIETWTPMEVSTGLFADCVAEEGTWNNENYTLVATNIRADHLAILTNKAGACSIQDGVGLLVNQAQEPTKEQENETKQVLNQILDIVKNNQMSTIINNDADIQSVRLSPNYPSVSTNVPESISGNNIEPTDKVKGQNVNITLPKEDIIEGSPLKYGYQVLQSMVQVALIDFLKVDPKSNVWINIVELFDTFVIFSLNNRKYEKINYKLDKNLGVVFEGKSVPVIVRPTYVLTDGTILNSSDKECNDINLLQMVKSVIANEIKSVLSESVSNVSLPQLSDIPKSREVTQELKKKIEENIKLYREAIAKLTSKMFSIQGRKSEVSLSPEQVRELEDIKTKLGKLKSKIIDYARDAFAAGVQIKHLGFDFK
jgi:6-pyruvoyl-tetrahydropterin synthase